MNSEKINQRLTLAANVGVLIGVIFLALEIRHSSDMAQAQMADSAVAGHNELNFALISDPQVARVFVVGLYEPSKPADVEAVQFAAWMLGRKTSPVEKPYECNCQRLLLAESGP